MKIIVEKPLVENKDFRKGLDRLVKEYGYTLTWESTTQANLDYGNPYGPLVEVDEADKQNFILGPSPDGFTTIEPQPQVMNILTPRVPKRLWLPLLWARFKYWYCNRKTNVLQSDKSDKKGKK